MAARYLEKINLTLRLVENNRNKSKHKMKLISKSVMK